MSSWIKMIDDVDIEDFFFKDNKGRISVLKINGLSEQLQICQSL